MLVDSHCHLDCLDLTAHQGRVASALDAARANGVVNFLCVCITMENFDRVLAIAEQHQDVYASVGCHPNTTEGASPSCETLVAYAKHPKVKAIGETGLDYCRVEPETNWQLTRFRQHIRAANACQLPLIIHTRDAEADTIRLMREENAQQAGGVLHCFTGTLEMAEAALAMGFYISFSGIITFKNARSIQEVARQIPLDRILIETDSPYLAPVPFRGKPNEPAYVKYVAETLATLRGISVQAVAQATTENYSRLFRLSVPSKMEVE